MYQKIRTLLHDLETRFDEIPEERKVILAKISAYIQAKYDKNATPLT